MNNVVPVSRLNRARRAAAGAPEVRRLDGSLVGERVVDVLDVAEGYAPYHVSDKGKGGYEVELPEGRGIDWYDVIGLSTSAGKDSLAEQIQVHRLAKAAGVEDRIVAVHCDLGEDAEWPDTADYARLQAEHFGHRFVVVSRLGTISDGVSKFNKAAGMKNPPLYEKGAARGSILDQVLARHGQFQKLADELEARGEAEKAADFRKKVAWPDAANRWCTKDFKTGPAFALYTELAAEWRKANPELAKERPCRILNCLGIRGEESPKRAEKPDLKNEVSNKNRHIDTWHPIKWWTKDKVWAEIAESGAPHHWAYDMGMPRLSCSFCIMANKASLVIAGRLRPETLDRYIEVEKAVGARFKNDLALADVKVAIEAGEDAGEVGDWDD